MNITVCNSDKGYTINFFKQKKTLFKIKFLKNSIATGKKKKR